MKRHLLRSLSLLVFLITNISNANDGCIIKNVLDFSCESSRRLVSTLDSRLNVCVIHDDDALEISGLYCKSPQGCYKDQTSSYSEGDTLFSWYNCYPGALPILRNSSEDPSHKEDPTMIGCVVKNVKDELCPSGRRIFSKKDLSLTACADYGIDSTEIPGAFCMSSFSCLKDFQSLYLDGESIYAWYNCQPGAIPIY